MFLLIILAILAVAGIVATFVIVPRGQGDHFVNRDWAASQHQTRVF
jgi:hypothetical protein